MHSNSVSSPLLRKTILLKACHMFFAYSHAMPVTNISFLCRNTSPKHLETNELYSFDNVFFSFFISRPILFIHSSVQN